MPTRERIAHDLALVYLTNRFASEVFGEFDASTGGGAEAIPRRSLARMSTSGPTPPSLPIEVGRLLGKLKVYAAAAGHHRR